MEGSIQAGDIKRFFQLNKVPLLLLLLAASFYISFGYYLDRNDFFKLFSLYAALFFLSWKLIQLKKNSFWFLAGAAVLFRVLLFAAIPNLSQDFYRFIWDGKLLIAGINPYLSIPEEWITAGNLPFPRAEELYNGMGFLNGGNPTNYPPLHQGISGFAAFITGKSIMGSVIIMRIFIIFADIGILYFGKKLLEKMGIPAHRIFWFILNPLIIFELTGNLHFEGIMLFFLIFSFYLLFHHKWISSAIFFGLSVLTKLFPLMFLPLLFGYFYRNGGKRGQNKLGIKRLIGYYFVVGAVVLFGFLPFFSSISLRNFSESIALWFQKFEFNAGIWYVVRWIGYQVEGYNILIFAGKVLPVIVFLILLGLAFFRKNSSLQKFIVACLLGMSAYLFLSTTVHPWYLATPLLLSVFTRYRFAIVWSFLVMLSYFAYSQPSFEENLWIIAAEYLIVLAVFIAEVFRFSAEHKVNEKNSTIS